MKFVDDERIPDEVYPELRGVLHAFADEVTAVLGEKRLGIYMVGSLASGDFDRDSDVDFLVVIRSELTEVEMERLQEVQTRIHAIDCYPARHLEGSYISLADLNDAETVGQKPLYYFDNGSTTPEFSTHDNQWHVRWVLRERGITLAGLRAATLLDPIPTDKILVEVRGKMQIALDYFESAMNGPIEFGNSRFGQSYYVLSICRMLHTLRTGTVQSKKAGAEWAKGFVDPEWVDLIEQAWEEREGVRFMVKIGQLAEPALLQRTLEFMQYGVGLARGIELQ